MGGGKKGGLNWSKNPRKSREGGTTRRRKRAEVVLGGLHKDDGKCKNFLELGSQITGENRTNKRVPRAPTLLQMGRQIKKENQGKRKTITVQ